MDESESNSAGFPELPQEPTEPVIETGSEEAIQPLQLEMLDRRVVTYWLISGTVSFLFLSCLGAASILIFRESLPEDSTLLLAGVITVASLFLGWTLIAPSLAYARWRFSITGELLLARFGIIFHEEKAIPISRMQHVDLTRGPIERLFGLATLVVFTAGTEGASFRLPGLAVFRAEELRDQILEARGDDVI
ncbi:MAG: PH domain-containing protein [Planctomycetota bacterium]|jgi:membrane protein YdbS with pleckstrin-like domain